MVWTSEQVVQIVTQLGLIVGAVKVIVTVLHNSHETATNAINATSNSVPTDFANKAVDMATSTNTINTTAPNSVPSNVTVNEVASTPPTASLGREDPTH